MPKPIQNPDLAQQLVGEFDLKGRVKLELDERVVPVVITADVRPPDPSSAGLTCALFRSAPAVAARNTFILVTPAAGRRLEVLECNIRGAIGKRFTLMRPSDVAGMNITFGGELVRLSAHGPSVPAAAINPRVASRLESGDGLVITGDQVQSGDALDHSFKWDAGRIVLFGRPTSQPIAFAAWVDNNNTQIIASFLCREFPDI